MEDQKRPEDDGLTHIQRLNPEQFDIVLGSPLGKRKVVRPASAGSRGRNLIILAVLGLAAYALATLFHTNKPTKSVVIAEPEPAETMAPLEDAVPVAVVKSAAEPRPTPMNEAHPTPAPIERPNTTLPAQGMVSQSYMAGFRADLQHNNAPQRTVKVEIVTANLREWDGRNRYRSQWKVYNNHIEDDSVCFNFPGATVEHRECRKAAQVFFKEQCREWTKRSDSDREAQSKATQQRYCGAAGTFNPAG
ncbi:MULTISPECIES: hypothetical protein [unclassified Pseudomonas]|uniref:hypothetical protein n=1 Tax=unclassified Pseudomonas TaxID=196821 RepID=UPI002AC8F5E8|nr:MULTISPECIES: hypothetical protein [unclassified Pseudomonas]MEB0040319.1 hypothetical protein [Pseudomonas sp. MH10]MEB0077394.1 hypothetical protein [Pseudomonas sp. MH10out]MEB0092826.1 hypothetical protein [Pseudomonas sp. CCI4.2]MEB0101151.1 hypothetical protein [Pseudomonas sp. CCI3.2]MEB0120572.1 hypothetical protein [Pseudomonas sp. CCI1.2]